MLELLNPEQKAKITSPAETVRELSSAIESGNENSAVNVLKKGENREALIVNRGKKSANTELLLQSFGVILDKLKPGTSLEDFDGETLVSMMKSNGLPEEILPDLMSAAVHLRKDILIMNLYNELANRKDLSPVVTGFIRHHYASWVGTEGLKESSRRMNDEIENEAKSDGYEKLRLRAKVGRILHTSEYKKKAPIFAEIFEDMLRVGDIPNALRVKQMEVAEYLGKAIEQFRHGDKKRAFEFIVNAKEIAKSTLEISDEKTGPGHSNAKVVAYRLLARIYELEENTNEAGKYIAKAKKWGKDFRYQTE